MTTTYKTTLTTSVVFSNADENTVQNGNVSFQRGNLALSIETVDDKLDIDSVETVEQTDGSSLSKVTSVATVTTTDTAVKIVSLPSVTDERISIISNAEETTIDDKFVTTITSTFSFNDPAMYAYVESVRESSLTAVEAPKYRYLVLKHDLVESYLHGNPGNDYLVTCSDMYSLMNVSVVKMSEQMYQTLKHTWGRQRIIEIDEKTAFYGSTFFGEIRPVAKVWEAKSIWYGEKVPTEITPEIQEYIKTVMRSFAYQIIGDEFERRLLAMRSANDLEVATWEIQKHEAREWLDNQGQNGSKTPFLDYLSEEHGKDKTELANTILTNAEKYEDDLSTLLVQQQKIFKQFKNAASVWDLNILYEDYLGVQMPIKQAIALGRTVSDVDWSRKDEWSIKGNGYYF